MFLILGTMVIRPLTASEFCQGGFEWDESCILLPFGADAGDTESPMGGDLASDAINVNFPFFGTIETDVFVSIIFFTIYIRTFYKLYTILTLMRCGKSRSMMVERLHQYHEAPCSIPVRGE